MICVICVCRYICRVIVCDVCVPLSWPRATLYVSNLYCAFLGLRGRAGLRGSQEMATIRSKRTSERHFTTHMKWR